MSKDRPSICYETGLDEAFLVGTEPELRAFATELLAMLDGPKDQTEFHSVTVKSVSGPQALTEPMNEVVLNGVVLVDSKTDRQTLVNDIRVNNADDPIDWSGSTS